MKPDIYVDVPALRTHADQVSAAADTVQAGVAGVRHMSRHHEIYGILCSPLFQPLATLYEEMAMMAFHAAGDNTRRVAECLRATADGYEEADLYLARLIQGKEKP
jgi:hypothetical protein